MVKKKRKSRKRKTLLKAKPTSLLIMLILGLLLVLFNVMTWFGLFDLNVFIPSIVGLAIVLILVIEASYMNYLKASTFKKLKFWDFVNIFTLIIAGGLLILSILGLGLFDGTAMSEWFKNMAGIITSTAGVLVLIHLFWK